MLQVEKASAEEDEDATDSDVNNEKHVPDHGTDSEGVVHVGPEDGTDSEDKDADDNKVFFVFCLVFFFCKIHLQDCFLAELFHEQKLYLLGLKTAESHLFKALNANLANQRKVKAGVAKLQLAKLKAKLKVLFGVLSCIFFVLENPSTGRFGRVVSRPRVGVTPPAARAF